MALQKKKKKKNLIASALPAIFLRALLFTSNSIYVQVDHQPESDLLPEVYRLNLPELYLVPLNYCRERVNMYVAGS